MSNRPIGLPTLLGSADQVILADRLREGALDSDLNQVRLMPLPPVQIMSVVSGLTHKHVAWLYEVVLAQAVDARRVLVNETDAAWWVAQRHGISALVFATFDEALCQNFPHFEGSNEHQKIVRWAHTTASLHAASWDAHLRTIEPDRQLQPITTPEQRKAFCSHVELQQTYSTRVCDISQ